MKTMLLLGLITTALLTAAAQMTWGDDHDDHWNIADLWRPRPGVETVSNRLYVEECASCHMAYPPGLLPASSWEKMMSTLDDHFGDNAELDTATSEELTRYLVAHSADKAGYRRSRRIARSLRTGAVPIRITELRYIRHEHEEIPDRLIEHNPDVGSLSYCDACHPRAEQGSFSERAIRIPGYGRWDD